MTAVEKQRASHRCPEKFKQREHRLWRDDGRSTALCVEEPGPFPGAESESLRIEMCELLGSPCFSLPAQSSVVCLLFPPNNVFRASPCLDVCHTPRRPNRGLLQQEGTSPVHRVQNQLEMAVTVT